MKCPVNLKILPGILGILGFLALLLKMLITVFARDEKGLFIPGHPLILGLWLLTGAAAVLAAVGVGKAEGTRKFGPNFPPSLSGAIGCGIMAVTILITTALNWQSSGLELVRYLLGLAAGFCLVVLTYARFRGLKINFLFSTFVCLFFAVHMVSRYRIWSGDPQLLNYVFEVFACVSLTLFAYHQAAFSVAMGNRRMQLLLGLLAGFFCLTALPGSDFALLYGGGAVWTLTNLCNLNLPPRHRRIAPEAPRDNAHETA